MEEEEQEQEEEESGILGDGFSAYFPSFAKNLLRVKVENVPFGCFDSECCCSVLNVTVLSLMPCHMSNMMLENFLLKEKPMFDLKNLFKVILIRQAGTILQSIHIHAEIL